MKGPEKARCGKVPPVYLASKINTTLGANITFMLTQSGSIW